MRLRARATRERRARLEAETIAERFARDALHDPLTGLANRAFLLDRLELALARAERLESRVGLLLLDLDGFKTVNDRLGHGAGDRLLIEIARRLRSAVRSTDLVARLGGDEFLLLCEDVRDEAALTTLADAVAAATATPWLLDGTRVAVTASIGVRLAVGASGPTWCCATQTSPGMRPRRRPVPMGRVRHRHPHSGRRARRPRGGPAKGHRQGELVAWYQPAVNLQTGEVTGAEALVRWQHPSRGLLTPDDFILAAEECGLIGQLGAHMLATASHQAVAWGYPQVGRMMHVNTTARELSTDGFPATVSAILAAAGLPKTGRIGFELFDQTKFGATDFMEHVNYRRALEGELERTMASMGEIEQARVHLTFAKDSVFTENRLPAKGSVVLKLRAAIPVGDGKAGR